MPSGCLHGDTCEYLHEPKMKESQPKTPDAQPKADTEAKPKATALASVAIVALASALAGRGGLEFVANRGTKTFSFAPGPESPGCVS